MHACAGADEREVPERAAPGDGEQRAAAGVGRLLRRPAAAGAPGAAAGAGGPGRGPPPLQGLHLEGVQDLLLPDQARRQPPRPLRVRVRHHAARRRHQLASLCSSVRTNVLFLCVVVCAGTIESSQGRVVHRALPAMSELRAEATV